MKAADAMKARPTLGVLDAVRTELAQTDLDGEPRKAIRAWLKAERDEQHRAFAREDGSFNRALNDAIKAIQIEDDRRDDVRAAELAARHTQSLYAAKEQRREERAQRWRDLSALERALYVVADKTGNDLLLQVVNLVRRPAATANLPLHRIPDAFDPE